MPEYRVETLRLAWLETFLASVDCGTQELAAERLGVSQPTIGNHIRSLEKWLGHKLFSPGSPRRLTSRGSQFVSIAKDVSKLIRESRHARAIATDPKPFSFVWLLAFLEVLECGSHTAAGKSLGWSQSTVSRYIKHLEDWLGYPLFSGFVAPVPTNGADRFQLVARDVLYCLRQCRSSDAAARPIASAQFRKKTASEATYDVYRAMRNLQQWLVWEPNPAVRKIFAQLHKKFARRLEIESPRHLLPPEIGTNPIHRHRGKISGRDIDMSFLDKSPDG